MCSEREEKTEKPLKTQAPAASPVQADAAFGTETFEQSLGLLSAAAASTEMVETRVRSR